MIGIRTISQPTAFALSSAWFICSPTLPKCNDEMAKIKRTRLDLFLVEQGFFSSREQAQRAVMAGEVRIGDQIVRKSSVLVQPGTAVSLQARVPYVSRGGIKLAGALDHFEISP